MRILGSTILDRTKGIQYQVVQTISGDNCTIAITSRTTGQETPISRVKQVPISTTGCKLKITEGE